ncbi:MAG: hypothetical protein AAGU11_17125 [Syntrophobacteraceae bacterium]
MENFEGKECVRGRTAFVDGDRLCLLNKCMTCDDGEWTEERIEGWYDDLVASEV